LAGFLLANSPSNLFDKPTEEIPMETIHTGAAHNVKVFYGYPGKSFFSYNFETKEYAIYISEEVAKPETIIKRALEDIERREGLVRA
ncbi:hypothetical protein LIR37_20520, partial [Flavonifractor plautii]